MNDRIEKIYNHGVAILEKVGIKLNHLETLALLKENSVRVEADIAFFTREQIESWISKAPESFTLHAQNSLYNCVIGKDHRNLTAGYGCPTVYELDGTSRNAELADYIKMAKLVHQCDHFSINGGILAQPNDVPPELSHLVMVYAALIASDKCLMGIPGNEHQMTQIMEMAAIMFGGKEALKTVPRVLTMISTISPLLMDEMALSSIMVSARYNQPMIISPASTAGTTGPIDLAGNLALSTAEALAAIVIAQMFRPGVPVIFGLQCNIANLKTGNISIGSPAFSLQTKYVAALARMLKLPSRSGGATTDAVVVGPQSGYESMLALLNACTNSVNLIVHSAGILDSYAAISYEKFIIDLEIIDMVNYYLADFETNDTTLNLDLIREVGPGGQFLTSMDTMKKCRSHSWEPRVGVRGKISREKALDLYFKNVSFKLKQMIDDYQKPELSPDTMASLNEFMIHQGVSPNVLSAVTDLINNNLEA